MDTPWSRARQTRSEQQEKRLGALPGGKQGVNSGRIWRWKRDGTLHDYLIEARTNENPRVRSYRIQQDEFQSMEREARMTPPGLRPAMQIQINDLRLIVTLEDDWLRDQERLTMLEAAQETGE